MREVEDVFVAPFKIGEVKADAVAKRERVERASFILIAYFGWKNSWIRFCETSNCVRIA